MIDQKEEIINCLTALCKSNRISVGETIALENAIKELEQTRWIPCSERLPEESGDYLVTTKWKGSYSGDVYIETNMAVYRKKSKEWDCVDVIAWAPIPQPYAESEEWE